MLPTPTIRTLDEKVYEPAEDSYLLLDCFEQDQDFLVGKFSSRNKIPLVVEIGAGSGIVTTFVKQNICKDGIFIATDLNPHACRAVMQTARENKVDDAKIESCQMDLTSSIKSKSVDVLIFNPPYVPAEEVPLIPETEEDDTWLDLALCGGPIGMDVTWKVLHDLGNTLSADGVAYILFCARNNPKDVKRDMEQLGWKVDTVIERKAGWEVLCILRFQRVH